jgi:hypothetical protein
MYDYHCKNCENLGLCMSMMNIPMMRMPMPEMPMMNMPVFEEEDGDLKRLYPKIYIRIYPMVKHHCDMMTSMHGIMYCPGKDEMDYICKEICDKYEEHYKDDEDDEDDDDRNDDNNDMRQRRRRIRRRGIRDLIRILLIRDLLGRRHYGGYWG